MNEDTDEQTGTLRLDVAYVPEKSGAARHLDNGLLEVVYYE